jgi:uncharacterized protein YegP (UPF0339 family)
MTRRRSKVVYYRDRKREFRWRFIAANGKEICKSSEGYQRIGHCEESFALVRFEDAEIERTY